MDKKQFFVNVNGKENVKILCSLKRSWVCRCTVSSVISWLDQFIGKLPLVTAYENHNI